MYKEGFCKKKKIQFKVSEYFENENFATRVATFADFLELTS